MQKGVIGVLADSVILVLWTTLPMTGSHKGNSIKGATQPRRVSGKEPLLGGPHLPAEPVGPWRSSNAAGTEPPGQPYRMMTHSNNRAVWDPNGSTVVTGPSREPGGVEVLLLLLQVQQRQRRDMLSVAIRK